VRLVGPAGEQVGIVRIEDALRLAQESDLDLVEVAANEHPPVCKLMDYGKFKYETALKARESRRNQVNTVIKEMKLRPKIDPHDYETKKGHVIRFLKMGDKVKITIMFRGREQSRDALAGPSETRPRARMQTEIEPKDEPSRRSAEGEHPEKPEPEPGRACCGRRSVSHRCMQQHGPPQLLCGLRSWLARVRPRA
jgi:translation initiation factor IF-3